MCSVDVEIELIYAILAIHAKLQTENDETRKTMGRGGAGKRKKSGEEKKEVIIEEAGGGRETWEQDRVRAAVPDTLETL